MKKTALIRCLVALFFVFFSVARSDAAKQLILGVHPYLQVEEIQKRFTPLADYLAGIIGMAITVRVGSSYDDHITAVGTNRVDIAFMGPASYVLMTESYGVKPLLARLAVDGCPTFSGIIVTRKGSPVTSLEKLRGKRFAFGAKDSTMSHLVPRYMLRRAGIQLSDLGGHSFLNSHENVALAVLTGDYDAGAVKEEVFLRHKKDGLVAVARTPAIPEHLFVASTTLPPEVVATLRKALLFIVQHSEGKNALTMIKKKATGLVAVSDRDYDSLRTILATLQAEGVLQ